MSDTSNPTQNLGSNTSRILFLTPDDSFPPRIYKAVKTLSEESYQVKVIGWNRGKQRSLFQLPDGVLYEPIKFQAPYGSLLLIFYLCIFYFLVARRLWAEDFDIIHCCRFDMLLPASIVAKLRKKKLIYDAFEHYPLMVGNHFQGTVQKVVVWVFSLFEETLARSADLILTVDTAEDILKRRFETINDNVVVIQNVPEVSDLVLDEELGSIVQDRNPEERWLFYAGGLMQKKGVFEMVRSFKHVHNKLPATRLLLAGLFTSEVVENQINILVSELELSDAISFLGYIPYEQVRRYAYNSEVGLELYHHHPYLSISKGSSKLFMYMEAGLPIVASDLPGIGSLIRETGAGLVVDPYDPETIAHAILSILSDNDVAEKLSAQGREAFRTKYNWDVEKATFLSNYEVLIRNAENIHE